jgi:dATP pyrophosphohydrolase
MTLRGAKYKRPESVLVVVHDPDGCVLLLKRSDIADFWQSVTGSLAWGESPRGAAVRELEEETGIVAGHRLLDWKRSVTFRILEEFRSRYAPGTEENLEHLFSIEVDRDQPVRLDAAEHVAYAWKTAVDAMEMVWSWSNRDAIAAVAKKHRWI